MPGPASAPGVGSAFGRRQGSGPSRCRCPRALVSVGAVGRSRPGAGPTPFHKCLIPAQSRSSATHKHLGPSSHSGVPTAPRQLLLLYNRLRRKGAGGDPTEPPQAAPPRPPLVPAARGVPGPPDPSVFGLRDLLVLTLYDNKVGFYFGAGGRCVLVCVSVGHRALVTLWLQRKDGGARDSRCPCGQALAETGHPSLR